MARGGLNRSGLRGSHPLDHPILSKSCGEGSFFSRQAHHVERAPHFAGDVGLGRVSCILMEFAAAQQPLRDVGGLKRRALGRRMGGKVARRFGLF
jgi:hypothetical protein